MPSPGMRGWYVELDSELVRLFEQMFPGHGAKVRVTANAVIASLRSGELEMELVDSFVLKPQEGSHVSRDTGRAESSNRGAEADRPSPQQRRTQADNAEAAPE